MGYDAELNLGNGNMGSPSFMSFYSLILKDIAVSASQVQAMMRQTGFIY